MEIKKYIAIVRHWLWLIILGAVLAGVVAYIVNRNQTPIYQASASYLIDTAPGSNSNSYTEVLVETKLTSTFVQLIDKLPVYEQVIAELGLDPAEITASDVRRKVSVSAPQDSQIFVVTVQDTDRVRAAQIANTIGVVFSQQNQDRQSLRYLEPITKWTTQLEDWQATIIDIETQLSAFGDDVSAQEQIEINRLTLRLNEAQDNYNRGFQTRQELEIEQARSADNVIPVEQAQVPAEGSFISPRTTTNTILATIVGGMLALGIVLLIEYLDDTVKTPDEILEHTGLSTLATIGFIKGEQPSDRLVTYLTPRAPISEAYRVLRTNLSFAAIDSGLKSALVTSSSPGEGKSTTSANLAVVMAQTGRRVVIIDADLRRPSQHKIFNVSNNQGLTTALLDSSTPVNFHLQETTVAGLRLMASGPLPPNPAELLNSQRMQDVVAELLEEVDFVLVDTPPVLTVADAAILAPSVDGCVLVAEVGSTRRETLMESSSRLGSTGASLFGLILNRSKPGRAGYYQYYYDQRYYTYDYATTNPGANAKPRSLLGWLTGGSGNNS